MSKEIRGEAQQEQEQEHEHEHQHDGAPCAFCQYEFPFVLPPLIAQAAREERLVLFAGAGISTENSSVFPTSLYADALSLVGDDLDSKATFPAVMSAFEEKYGRKQLIQTIVERLDYVKTFPYLDWASTRFHRELSTIRGVQTVITTNWDTAFEDICQARPFVVDDDYGYFDLPGRKVFKIHGSTRNVSTLIATDSDYQEAEARFANSALGSTLKHVLSTEVVVFIGFSLADPDFTSVYRGLIRGLGKARPPAYFVSPFESEAARDFGLIPIQTDGTFFLSELKKRLIESDDQLPDERIDRAIELGHLASDVKDRVAESDWKQSVPAFYSLAYLDGILDATGRIGKTARTGDYTNAHKLLHLTQGYDHLFKIAIERKRWWDSAYINGYLNVLVSLSLSDDDVASIPLFEDFTADEYPKTQSTQSRSEDDLETETVVNISPDGEIVFNSDAIVAAFEGSGFNEQSDAEHKMRAMISSIAPDTIPQHTPFLDGVIDSRPPTPLQ